MRDYVDALLTGGLLLCALMILVWCLRIRSQGTRAFVMASSFAVMGLLILGLKFRWSDVLVVILACILFLLLAADVAIKAKRQYGESRK
jgi:chromate transport protein ChrA